MTVHGIRDEVRIEEETDGRAAHPARTDGFDDAFRALLERVRPGAADRERDRVLLYDEVAELRRLGFTSLRLPAELGGAGLGLEDFFDRLIDLASADPSLAHLYRGHIAFVEGLRYDGIDSGRPLDDHEAAWVTRIAAGDLIGNAQSERQETADLTTTIERDGDDVFVTGTKYYTTGSIYADWIHLSALDGDDRVGITVDASHPGVRSIDDWDGFGQLLTGSGTTTFDRVPVHPGDIVVRGEDEGRGHHLAAVFQLVLLAVVAGIADAALRDTVAFVRPRRRIFGSAGETLPRLDPLVQATVGELSATAHAARSLVLAEARKLDAVLVRRETGDVTAGDLRDAMLDVFRLQQIVLPLVLGALTELFEVGGASAVGRGFALDRHWRNARTVASHNPAVQRKRAIGLFELEGTLPEWRAPGRSATAESVTAESAQEASA
ncbi:hypothetical protein FLP10_10145 [Agromyces intestinalis]|uniref:Acyl-CoA dehydrogenase C-terminal domain-containing protein n=1 Tax=Agromyces intestinalis TaxID=2592652 RepID=A0A5C1YF11_9MICO|nr:hypothetical protein [Agromyces intestinalis]QEO14726.1 hypothetical protein FLP10_10145 [Agromyces intestinalis]